LKALRASAEAAAVLARDKNTMSITIVFVNNFDQEPKPLRHSGVLGSGMTILDWAISLNLHYFIESTP
jgi:hypothetical protein